MTLMQSDITFHIFPKVENSGIDPLLASHCIKLVLLRQQALCT